MMIVETHAAQHRSIVVGRRVERTGRLGKAAPWLMVIATAWVFSLSWINPLLFVTAWIGLAMYASLAILSAPRAAFLRTYFAGALALTLSFAWVPETLGFSIQTNDVVAWGIFLALVAWEAIPFGLFGWCVSRLVAGRSQRLWLVPCSWIALELWWPKIFPWLVCYTQLEFPLLIQIADLAGPSGVSFVVAAAAGLVAGLVDYSQRRDVRQRRALVIYGVAVAAAWIGTLTYGSYTQAYYRQRIASAASFNVALIQVDIAYNGCEQKMQQRSRAVEDDVDLICWPETSIGIYCDELESFRDERRVHELSRLPNRGFRPLPDARADLLAAGKTYARGAGEYGPFAVTAFLTNPEEQIVGRYNKRILMPIGEYCPGQQWWPALRKWVNVDEQFTRGTESRPLRLTNGTRAGVLICYEDIIRAAARDSTRSGAEMLVSLINATAFESPVALEQHKRLAVMRAVENRRYFLRASGTGVSCIISPLGIIEVEAPKNIDATVVGRVAALREVSLYTRVGDAFAYLCTAAFAVMLLVTRREWLSR